MHSHALLNVRRRVVGGLALAAVTAQCVVLLAPGAASAEDSVAGANSVWAADASDPEQAAMAQAVETGQPVVVDQLTTDSEVVTAEPDGTFTAAISAGPVRERGEDGSWHPLNADLQQQPDGTWTPVSSIGDIVLSGGGEAGTALATYTLDDTSYSLRSPFALPKPSVNGDVATYAEVLPGVDLVSTTSNAGFTYNWVVKTPAAAQDARIRSLTLPVDSSGLASSPEKGGTAYVDGQGAPVLWTPAPIMWDSSGSLPSGEEVPDAPVETSEEAVDEGPSTADQVSTVSTTATTDQVVLRPDTNLLDDPDTVFPVVIDPALSYNPNRNGWTAVWDNFPSKSFWQTDHSLGAGYEGYQQFKVVRSYFRFNTDKLGGKYIISAEMNVRQIHDASCTSRPTDVYRTGAISTSTTWNKQPTRYGLQDTNSSTAGCGSGTAMVGWDVTSGVTTLANGSSPTGTFMIRARDEGDKIAWKQYDDAEAELAVKYVSRPNVPTNLAIKSGSKSYPCGTSGSPTVIGATSVTISAKVTSADGASASLRGVFRRRDMAASDDMADVAASTAVASGGISSISWSLSNNHTYRFKAKNRVTFSGGPGQLDSAFNDTWCYLKADTTRPGEPDVTSAVFTECAADIDPTECPATGTTHTPGSFHVDSPSSDAVSYSWKLNGSGITTIGTSGGAAKDITVTPDRDINTFEVWSNDGANEGIHYFFTFRVNRKAPSARWTFDDAVDPGANSGDSTGVLTLGTAEVDNRGRVGAALRPQSAPSTAQDVAVDTTRDFTVSTWVRVDSDSSATFVAATTPTSNAFELGYDAAAKQWYAGRRSSSVIADAVSSFGLTRAWTHLAATYDASANKVTLYVNGTARSSATYSSAAWAAAGWSLGCGNVGGAPSSCLDGAVDEVSLWDAVLSGPEVAGQADPADPLSGHPVTASAAAWTMSDDATASAAADSCYGSDLALANVPSPAFGVAGDGMAAGVLTLPGTAVQRATSSHPVADATGSFSVAAWVKPSDPTRSAIIAQQHGSTAASWTLAYRPATGGGQWVFQRTSADTATAAVTEVRSPVISDVSEDWTLVIGVFDNATDTISLYVNGRTFEDGADPSVDAVQDTGFGAAWAAKGQFEIGNGELGGAAAPFEGEIDSVELLAGVLDASTVLDYYNSWGM